MEKEGLKQDKVHIYTAGHLMVWVRPRSDLFSDLHLSTGRDLEGALDKRQWAMVGGREGERRVNCTPTHIHHLPTKKKKYH